MHAFQVRTSLDVFAPRQAALELARQLGFPRHERHEVAIAVSELASNIVKYGVRGSIEISTVRDARHGIGLSIVARDVGPPFRNLAMALQDGCDDNGPIELIRWDVMARIIASPDMWIGAVAGVAMIAGAIYFRRQRELAD